MIFTFQLWQLALLLIAVVLITSRITRFVIIIDMFLSSQKGELFLKGRDGNWIPYDPTMTKKEETNEDSTS